MDALKEARALLEHGRHASEWTLRQHLAALISELEAARAVVEAAGRQGSAHSPALSAALRKYTAAKAGKAVE